MPSGEHPNSRKNLRPVRNSEEAKARGSAGGLKSVEAKKRRKLARECMEIILSGKVSGEKAKKALSAVGFTEENHQNIALLMMSMFQKGVSTGDAGIIKSILEISGDINQQEEVQAPQININISAATKEDIEED